MSARRRGQFCQQPPAAPTQHTPFASARGGAQEPVVTATLPATLGEVLEANPIPGLNELFVAMGAALNTFCIQFVMVAEVDLEGGLDATLLEGYPLNPLQRAGLVNIIRNIFGECGYDLPTLGCKLPAPKAKAAPEPPKRATATEEVPPDQLVAISDVLDQAARGTAKLMTFTELAACRARYAEVAGDHHRKSIPHQRSSSQLCGGCLTQEKPPTPTSGSGVPTDPASHVLGRQRLRSLWAMSWSTSAPTGQRASSHGFPLGSFSR